MDWDQFDWAALERLRAAFLEGSAGRGDYWRGESDLAAYDQTFAQRIGWKWDFVLADLVRRSWRPPEGEVLDWGCGTGIAARKFLKHFGGGELALHDRSTMAMEFARRETQAAFPSVTVRCAARGDGSDEGRDDALVGSAAPTLLLSHVLPELNAAQLDALLELVRRATTVVWVEPGACEISRRLIACRERLRGEFQLVGPCTHQNACGLLSAGNERHWCHHFADTPTEVFMDSNWSRFARLAGIDLRRLPLSFLVLDRRPAPALAPGAVRVIGRPRMRKDAAILFGCDAGGVRDRRLPKRTFPQEYRLCKRGDCDSLQAWTLDGDEIVGMGSALP